MTAAVVCSDAVFARMLTRSLEARGVDAFACGNVETACSHKPDKMFIDAEIFGGAEKLPDGCDAVIFGWRGALEALGDVGDCAVYERPFVVSELLDMTVGKPSFGKDASKPKKHAYDGLRLYSSTHSATYRGEHIALSKKEFALLGLLIENKGEIVSRADALKTVFGENTDENSNVVDVYIKYLRQKIDERFGIKLITSVRGKGYTVITE